MRKLIATGAVLATVLVSGFAAWQAEAMVGTSGATTLPPIVQQHSTVQKAACFGRGRHCPRGFTWRCGPHRCWCGPC